MVSSATTPESAPVVMGLRERIAQHLAGTSGVASAWALVSENSLYAADERRYCKACDGLGFVAFSEERLMLFRVHVANMQAEAHGNIQKEQQILEKIEGERWSLNRDSVCKACRGSGYAADEFEEELREHDAIFTTVSCPSCRGRDHRNELKDDRGEPLYPKLMDPHPGSSCGETYRRNDRASEYEDVCPRCIGAAFVVPITARPSGRMGETGAYIEELEAVPVYYRPDEEPADAKEPGLLLAAIQQNDPRLAAAVSVLLGPRGDAWALHHWGRRFAIWPLTEHAETLAEESKHEPAAEDWYERKIETLQAERLAEAESDQGNPRRRALLAMIDAEARDIEARVQSAIDEAEAA